MPRVVILSEILTHYRQPFFERLRADLAAAGIELSLVYGRPHGADRAKAHTTDLAWGHPVRNHYLRVGTKTLCWQPAWPYLQQADLVIVEQASRHLVNYPLFARHLLGRGKLALWGHGQNFQPDPSRLGEAIKARLSRKVHWWFAYNDRSADVVAKLGFPRSRITSVQNAVDTRALLAARQATPPEALAYLAGELQLQGCNTCLFIGGMYPEKRLPFLLEACRLIREQVPDFEMLFIGAGPDDGLVEQAARATPWLYYLGPRFGADAVPYFMLSRLLLMPGLVGLVVLDALALEVPLVTTAVPYHSPEVSYLRPGENGVMLNTVDDAQAYANAVATLLRDKTRLHHLMAGCRHDRQRYTLENMVQRFAAGTRQALAAA